MVLRISNNALIMMLEELPSSGYYFATYTDI